MQTDQRKVSESLRITFTPLSRNRLRCNWNGVVIKHRQRHAAANRRWSELHPYVVKPQPAPAPAFKAVFVAPPPQPKLEAVIDVDGYVRCPNTNWGAKCNYLQRAYTPGETRCIYCGKQFVAVAAKPAESNEGIMEAEVINSHGDVNCPHCQVLNYNAVTDGRAAKKSCNYCHREFLAKPRVAFALQSGRSTAGSDM